jgi:hypothetical protein
VVFQKKLNCNILNTIQWIFQCEYPTLRHLSIPRHPIEFSESTTPPSKIWGFRLFASNAIWWKPRPSVGISGGTLLFGCGYIAK